MSGITPILDTLLHHVLGRHRPEAVRSLRARPLQPAPPRPRTREAHSDSRLDPRAADSFQRASGGTVARSALAAEPQAREPSSGVPRRNATVGRFSRGARLIADIQARAPAQPSALRPAAPLLPVAVPVDAHALAIALRQSIEASGLFYEAHLRRWHEGRFLRSHLAREPQVRRGLPIEGKPMAMAAKADPDAAAPDAGHFPSSSANGSGHVDPHLENTLRQQLEMLGTPILRWEGQPWAGLWMSLVLTPPHPQPDARSGRDGPRREPPGWHTRLTLHLRRLGEIRIDMHLAAGQVALEMVAAQATASRLERGTAALRKRLSAVDVKDVRVHVRAQAAG